MKTRALVPTLLTLGNAVCGLAAIAYASRIGKADSSPEADRFFLAASGWLICGAMLFDTLDGFFARLFKSAGRFGAELDSLCDAISFGAAPAFILLQVGPGREQPFLHQLLAAVATLYMMCAILRLARFNVESMEGSKNFKGLPSPAAAGCIASLAIVRGSLGKSWPAFDTIAVENILEGWATIGGVIVAVLMVSNVTYPHLTKQMLRGKRRLPLAALPLLLVATLVLREFALVVAFWTYAVSFFASAVWVRLLSGPPGVDGELPRRF
jgi:CDP-diacylglycerol--serine O-phosphatidyltransferase